MLHILRCANKWCLYSRLILINTGDYKSPVLQKFNVKSGNLGRDRGVGFWLSSSDATTLASLCALNVAFVVCVHVRESAFLYFLL